MKKRIWIALLLLALLAQLTLGAFATEAGEETQPEETPETAQAGQETLDGATEPTQEPTIPEPVVRGDGSGSTSAGPDSKQSLAPESALDLECQAAMLLEMNTGSLVYGKNLDMRREPASLTKVMTCLLAMERGNLDDKITISDTALKGLDPNGSSAGLVEGETLTLKELLYCLMISSANDAAPVIAEYISGSQDAFVELMNQRAKELGCTGTHFANPHGLHDDDHYSTARDLSRMMLEAMKFEAFREIIATERHYLEPTNKVSEERILDTTDFFISKKVSEQYYDSRVVGGKTGFTTPAGYCIMFVAEDEGLEYLCVILGAESYVTEESTTLGSFTQGEKLIDFGFDNYTVAQVLSPLSPVAQLPVQESTDSVVLTPKESLSTLLPVDYDPEKLTLEYTLSDSSGLQAPLEAGQTVGTVRRFYNGTCVGETELVTMTAIRRNKISTFGGDGSSDTAASGPWLAVAVVFAVLLLGLVTGVLILRAASVRKHKRHMAARNRRR